jgi:hypothetical protein
MKTVKREFQIQVQKFTVTFRLPVLPLYYHSRIITTFTLPCCDISGHITSNGRTTAEWCGKDSEGSSRGLIPVLFRHLSGGTEENHKTLRLAGVPAGQVLRVTATPGCSVLLLLSERRSVNT